MASRPGHPNIVWVNLVLMFEPNEKCIPGILAEIGNMVEILKKSYFRDFWDTIWVQENPFCYRILNPRFLWGSFIIHLSQWHSCPIGAWISHKLKPFHEIPSPRLSGSAPAEMIFSVLVVVATLRTKGPANYVESPFARLGSAAGPELYTWYVDVQISTLKSIYNFIKIAIS